MTPKQEFSLLITRVGDDICEAWQRIFDRAPEENEIWDICGEVENALYELKYEYESEELLKNGLSENDKKKLKKFLEKTENHNDSSE